MCYPLFDLIIITLQNISAESYGPKALSFEEGTSKTIERPFLCFIPESMRFFQTIVEKSF